MKKHINIPIFIPHLGCPNSCVFCNQRTISGVNSFDISAVRQIIDASIKSSEGAEREIAFFGGSFTGIEPDFMISLLEIGYSYVKNGDASGIRCSTRPDYINDDILAILKRYGVKTIELGIQSISDKVLKASKRGHTFKTTERACSLIVKNGFELVGQMMIGLPNSTLEDELSTADFISNIGAKSARIYPTVVFKGTELCDMARELKYTPLSVDDAVYRSAAACRLLRKNGVNVIRIGLCSSESVLDDENYFAGPMHPALGELVENEIYYTTLKEKFLSLTDKKSEAYNIIIPRGTTSKAVGQNKRNKVRLMTEFEIKELRFIEDDSIKALEEIRVQERKRATCT